jgi:hypothetical protein
MHDGACVGGAFVRIVRAAAAGCTPGAHEGVGYAYGLSNGPMGQRGRGRLTEGRRRLAALQRIARHPAWSAASSGQRAWSRAEVAVRLDELELALLREAEGRRCRRSRAVCCRKSKSTEAQAKHSDSRYMYVATVELYIPKRGRSVYVVQAFPLAHQGIELRHFDLSVAR